MTDIIQMDASRIAELVANRELSPVEVMKAHLDRIAEVNPKVNAIVTMADGALDAARKAEAAVKSDARLGPLHGVPFTVKDGIDTAGVLTQRGSPIFKGRVPDTDATVVARLKAAGGHPHRKDESAGIFLLDRNGQFPDGPNEQPLEPRLHPGRIERW